MGDVGFATENGKGLILEKCSYLAEDRAGGKKRAPRNNFADRLRREGEKEPSSVNVKTKSAIILQ